MFTKGQHTWNLTGDEDNAVRSLEVRRKGQVAALCTGPPNEMVGVFSDRGLGGDCAVRGVGLYEEGYMGVTGISSLVVGQGVELDGYTVNKFQGNKGTWTHGHHNDLGDWNDQIRSFEVRRTGSNPSVCYAAPNESAAFFDAKKASENVSCCARGCTTRMPW